MYLCCFLLLCALALADLESVELIADKLGAAVKIPRDCAKAGELMDGEGLCVYQCISTMNFVHNCNEPLFSEDYLDIISNAIESFRDIMLKNSSLTVKDYNRVMLKLKAYEDYAYEIVLDEF